MFLKSGCDEYSNEYSNQFNSSDLHSNPEPEQNPNSGPEQDPDDDYFVQNTEHNNNLITVKPEQFSQPCKYKSNI